MRFPCPRLAGLIKVSSPLLVDPKGRGSLHQPSGTTQRGSCAADVFLLAKTHQERFLFPIQSKPLSWDALGRPLP